MFQNTLILDKFEMSMWIVANVVQFVLNIKSNQKNVFIFTVDL